MDSTNIDSQQIPQQPTQEYAQQPYIAQNNAPQHKFSPWILLVIIMLLTLGFGIGAYFLGVNNGSPAIKTEPTNIPLQTITPTRSITDATPTKTNNENNTELTYTNNEGFSFKYPSTYVFGSADFMIPPYFLPSLIVSIERTESVMPSIHVSYYKQTAVFTVSKMETGKVSAVCYQDNHENQMTDTKNINGVTYHFAKNGGAAAGNDIGGMIYRTMHNNQCYEVALEVESSLNPIAMDETGGTELKNMSRQQMSQLDQEAQALQKTAHDALNKILLTFTFAN